MTEQKTLILLSSDTLAGYGLDHIFEIAKTCGFDGIDLATWKNFDSWNESYVQKLVKKHNLPVKNIQVSAKVNIKEMEQAFDLCDALEVDDITINAPKWTDFKTYNFLNTNIRHYKKQGIKKRFSLINPEQKSILGIIPKYRFGNIIEIIKKQKTLLALDISNLDEDTLETHFMRKISQFIPYLPVIYVSDKDRTGKGHLPPGEGGIKIPKLLEKLHKNNFKWNLSIKITLNKKDLSDNEKVELILTKSVDYLRENYKTDKTD